MAKQPHLSAVVAGVFLSETGLPALGIDNEDTVYIYDPTTSSNYRTMNGGDAADVFFYQTTKVDYADLALDHGSSSWNVNLLESVNRNAFTKAFVAVTVNNIYNQLKECFNCSCLPLACSVGVSRTHPHVPTL